MAAAALQHPGIVPVYDIGEAGGVHFFSMALVDGPSLLEYLRRRGQMDVGDSVTLVNQVASALTGPVRLR